MKILGRVLVGAAAGILATATMSGALAAARGFGLLGEPPPRKLTRKILGRLGLRLSRPAIDLATVASHFAYGAGAGSLYALAPRRLYGTATGATFGALVWSASYQGWIPAAGLMPRPLFDRPGRPAVMVLAHLIFGATVGYVARRFAGAAPVGSEPAEKQNESDSEKESESDEGAPGLPEEANEQVNPGDPGPPVIKPDPEHDMLAHSFSVDVPRVT